MSGHGRSAASRMRTEPSSACTRCWLRHGGWLIEAAKTYPSMTMLVGADVSGKMLDYARTQAIAQQVSDRVQFATMDALRMLKIPVEFFELAKQRLGGATYAPGTGPNCCRSISA